ncbi:uncharacterized protein cd93 [Paramormyrops kingsleyae]|uniref:uncharacterized protein cd93 n=1 Tax=Paramormyrops kingsleyae TaxID=1676925 RepID=UPI003B96AEA6
MMILFFVLFHFLRGTEGTKTEPAETICTVSACFTFSLTPLAFEDAQNNCQDNGGNLAVVTDGNEAAEIHSALSRIVKKHPGNHFQFWIGLKLGKGNCAVLKDDFRGFKWINGMKDTKYANWDREPKFTCIEDRCVAINHTSYPFETADLKWRDRSCKDGVGFVCKFNFKGMCKSLVLAGPGEITYTTPFVTRPLSDGNALTMLPYGTSAAITCQGEETYSVCKDINGFFGWTNPGPFCVSTLQSCKHTNGSCDHHCMESEHGEVTCGCREGYELGEDKVTCVQKDLCKDSLCKFGCVSGHTRYICTCPSGFQLAEDEISCTDIDECADAGESRVCEHTCVNINGSYDCICKNGYKMVDGKCQDIDECIEHNCPQQCLNSEGSFSCYCVVGYNRSSNGLSCVDIDECINSPCEGNCINTIGSYKCFCEGNYKLATNGITCIPIQGLNTIPTKMSTEAKESQNSKSVNLNVTTDHGLFKDTHSFGMYDESTTIRFEVKSSYTANNSLFSPTLEAPYSNRSVLGKNSFTDTWMFVSIMSSVAGLVILIIVILIVVASFYNREKSKKKKNLTPDNYCWVSSD